MVSHRRPEDPGRRGSKSRSFLDSRLKDKNGEVIQLKGDKFQEIFDHYDKNRSGELERKEIDGFLKDYINSTVVGLGEIVTDEEVQLLKDTFLSEFDDNQDGKISLREMSAILPVEESFFVMFRNDNHAEKGVDYMQVWKKYDRDYSGFIEIDELKEFLRDIIGRANGGKPVDENRLEQYTSSIMAAYDTNQDGKLGLSELVNLLPPEENFIQLVVDKALSLHKLKSSDVEIILDKFDKDHSGTLEGAELSNLAREMLSVTQKDGYYNAADVYELEKALLKGCDLNQDGRIDRRELALIIGAIANAQSPVPLSPSSIFAMGQKRPRQNASADGQ